MITYYDKFYWYRKLDFIFPSDRNDIDKDENQ